MTEKENQIIKLISFGPLVFIPLFVITVIYFIYQNDKSNFNKTLNNVKANVLNNKKQALQLKIEGIVDLVNYQNTLIKEKLTKKVKDRVISSHKIALKLFNQFKDTKTQEEIKLIIKTTLRPLIWNNGESFIWILNHKGDFILAPEYLRHLEGTSIINFQDATGRYVIQEEIEIVKNKKEGFIWDTFTKPDDPNTHYKQVAFVKDFAPYNWYLGSGEYLDTASKISNKEILNSIRKVSAKADYYIFLYDKKGNVLLNHEEPFIEGKNIFNIQNNRLQTTFEKTLEFSQENSSGFLSYNVEKSNINKIEKKYSYISNIIDQNWIIGSVIDESTINMESKEQTKLLYDEYQIRINYLIIIAVVLILLSLIIAFLISKYLTKTFANYNKNIKQKSNELEKSNIKLKYLNDNLESRVNQEIMKNKEKDKQLFEQIKMCAMRDMLVNIAHQWRQPLSAITSSIANMQIITELDEEFSKEARTDIINNVNAQCQYLSTTIDNFRSFFHVDSSTKETFNFKDVIEEVELLTKNAFENNHIKIIFELEDFLIQDNKHILVQSTLNLFNNAKDTILLNKIPIDSRYYFIKSKKGKKKIKIVFLDSGGGIEEDIIDKVFEPYFTTKHQSRGAGLGLYMTHQVINTHLNGDITVKNKEFKYEGKDLKGAEFIITLPIDSKEKTKR